MDKRLLKDYMLQFVGLPYRWGGDDTIEGFDCSGFAQEVLRAFGKDPEGDQTAQKLLDHFLIFGDQKDYVELGDLVFYGPSYSNITHIAIGIGPAMIIEAAGGNKTTNSLARAAKQNAYVRIRPFNYRDDYLLTIDPLY